MTKALAGGAKPALRRLVWVQILWILDRFKCPECSTEEVEEGRKEGDGGELAIG